MNNNQRDSNSIILSSALALLCGLAGGIFSSYFFNQPVLAQKNSVPGIIKARTFELVDKSGKAIGGLYSEDGTSTLFLQNNKGQILTAEVGNEYSGFYVQSNKKQILTLEMDNKEGTSALLLKNNKGQDIVASAGFDYSGFYINNNKKKIIRMDMKNKNSAIYITGVH